jgi:uncharacterized paraquat-inducible protein A
MKEIECLACGDLIQVPEMVFLGQKFSCPSCYTELEVISTNPLELVIDNFDKNEIIYNLNPASNSEGKDRIRCPRCNKIINITQRVWIGDRITCVTCGMEYQIVGLNPVEIDLPYDDTDQDMLDNDYDEDFYDLYKKIEY